MALSQAGYIVNELRTHLSPENVNMLVFLAKTCHDFHLKHFGYDATCFLFVLHFMLLVACTYVQSESFIIAQPYTPYSLFY